MPKIPDPSYSELLASGGLIHGGQPFQEESEEISAAERLVNAFESHEAQEKGIAERYGEIARESKNPSLKFLLQLIIADEQKHYQITHAMLSTLRGSLTWTRPEDAIQGLGDLKDGDLLTLTEEFIGLEKEGVKEYKKLIGESKGYYKDLFVLLFQTMIRDSEKHVEILEFLRKRLKEA